MITSDFASIADLSSTFTGIASAIRTKTGSSSAFKPAQLASEILNIPSSAFISASIMEENKYKGSNITSYSGNEIAIMYGAFENCTYTLSSVAFPYCKYIDDYAFKNCRFLSYISFPKCEYIGSNTFADCYSLTTANFSECNYIGSSAFYYCRFLSSLYLLGSSVVSLANSNAFNYTPLSAIATGKIYVPSSLYNDYIVATNWSTISARMVSM